MNKTIKKLIELIEKESISVAKAAKEMGISPSTLNRMISGETSSPNANSLQKIKDFIKNNSLVNGDNNTINNGDKNFFNEPETNYGNSMIQKLIDENIRLNRQLEQCKNELISQLKKNN